MVDSILNPVGGVLDRAVARNQGQALAAIRAERLARRIEKVLAKDSNRTAKAVVHDEAGNVLVIKDATYGTWDLPGGHLMEGESLDQGLHREVKEETGLEIIGESWRSTTNQGRTELFDTQVAGVKPRVTLSPEHTAFRWVEPDKAEELAAFWFQGTSANAAGSSRTSFYPQTGPTGVPAHQNSLKPKERVRAEAEKEIAKAVARVVALAEAEVLAKKQEDEAFWTYAAAAFFGAVMAAYGQSAKELAVIEQGADHGESVTEAEERAHAEQRAELLKDFPRRIRERLALEVKRGEELGETEAELHRRVGIEGEKILQGEGRVVAETEAQAICGSATLRALKRAGYETAFWVTVGDERVRDSHYECEAAGAVRLGDKFPNGCRFPGDPLAPLAETINCRCWLEGASRKSQPVAASDTGQRRAKPGGEFGANGEWYEGGKWIATQEDRIKQAPIVHELSPEEKERREQKRIADEKQAAHIKAWTEARRNELKSVLDALSYHPKDMWGNPDSQVQPNQFLLSLHQQLLSGGSLSPRQAEFAVKQVLGRRVRKNEDEWNALHQKITEDFEPGAPTYEATKPK